MSLHVVGRDRRSEARDAEGCGRAGLRTPANPLVAFYGRRYLLPVYCCAQSQSLTAAEATMSVAVHQSLRWVTVDVITFVPHSARLRRSASLQPPTSSKQNRLAGFEDPPWPSAPCLDPR